MELQAALVDSLLSPSAVVIGPLLVHLDSTSDTPGRNYAAPLRPQTPTAQDISALVALMRSAGRTPRMEFVAPNPGLEGALAAAGFAFPSRFSLMPLGSFAAAAPPAGVTVTTSPTDADLLGAGAVQNDAYDDAEEPAVAALRLRHTMDGGGFVAVAVLSGQPVGTGLATAPARGFCELAAVAVAPAQRRRGIAAAVASALTAAVLRAGLTPFLQADDGEVSLYERIGYLRVGEVVVAELLS